MALVGIGVDMLEIARMEKVLERRPNFARRVFTKGERAYCDRMARPAKHYAARFAAREAVLKALGTGFSRGIGLADVSVVRNEAGQPEAVLAGRALEIAREQGVREVALSLSYTHDVAVANAVAVTDEVRPKVEERPDPKAELQASFRAARSVIDDLERVKELGNAPAGPDAQASDQDVAAVPAGADATDMQGDETTPEGTTSDASLGEAGTTEEDDADATRA